MVRKKLCNTKNSFKTSFNILWFMVITSPVFQFAKFPVNFEAPKNTKYV